MKQKAITITILIMLGAALLIAPLSFVQGQTDGALGLDILQIVKKGSTTGITSGNVGDAVTVHAVLYRYNGQYLLYFNDELVDSNSASGFYVASNFTIPTVTSGNYTVTLTDVYLNYNVTSSLVVNPAYLVQPIIPAAPAQLQQGATVGLNVSVTAGEPNTTYKANITFTPPAPLNETYQRMVTLTTSSLGIASVQINFPDSTFTPSGSTTIYTGTYNAYFNQSLGQSQFVVGFTDKSEYHRQNTVTIRAVGYQPSQSATLQITNPEGTVVSSQTVIASGQGVISSTWNIPSAALVGTYNATITPQGTAKTVADVQSFEIPGYSTSFRALNIAGEPVQGILVEVFDQLANQRINGTTYPDGMAIMNLDAGSYTATVYWSQVKVGEVSVTITESKTFDLLCSLTNLQIKVQDKNGVAIPSTDLTLAYQYTNRTGGTQTDTFSVQTDVMGIYNLTSTLPNISYTITASKYGTVFNQNNKTLSNLPAQANYQATIICPEVTLTLTTVDYNSVTLSSARIELIEQATGTFYSVTTDNNGRAQLQVTFGQYRAKVYTGNTLLNETTINVLGNTQSQIRCNLFNLQVTVKVVDYFGTPISNINVEISRSGMASRSAVTQNDGTATFDNVVGGDLVVTAYLSGDQTSYTAKNLQVTTSTTVELSMANYVVVAGLVVTTTVLATIILIAIAIVLIICIVLYKKIGFKLRHKTSGK